MDAAKPQRDPEMLSRSHRAGTERRLRRRPSSYQYLLDLDVDLADEFDVRMRMVARTAVAAVTFDVDAGELPVAEWLAAAAPGPGVLRARRA